MNIVLDLIVLGIVLLSALISARKGFVKVLVETVGFIAAIVIAFSVSSPLADVAYDKVIEPPIIEAALNSAEEKASEEAENALPGFIADGSSVITDFTQSIKQNLSAGTETAVKSASQQIVKPVAVKILSLLFSVILILVLMIVVKFLARLLNKMFSFSIVGKLNRTLGGLVGVVKGVGFAIIFCMLISLILSFTGKPFLIFSQENINNTYLFKLLTEIIPFN